MKLVALFITFNSAFAKAPGLVLSGTVPLKADVRVNQGKIANKSSAGLVIKVQGRQPASETQVVQVSAP